MASLPKEVTIHCDIFSPVCPDWCRAAEDLMNQQDLGLSEAGNQVTDSLCIDCRHRLAQEVGILCGSLKYERKKKDG